MSKTTRQTEFVDVIDSAQRRIGEEEGREVFTDGFPLVPSKNIEEVESDPRSMSDAINDKTGFPNYGVKVYRRVFLIFRAWECCPRCKDNIADASINLPKNDGDIACRHLQTSEYEEVMNACMRGDALLKSETEITSKEGHIYVSVQWMVPVVKPAPQKGSRPKRMVGPLAAKKD